jgi:Baseplate J-like protein
MTGSTTDKAKTAEACGCCEDTRPLVPRPRDNLPGRNRLQLRVGTQAGLKAAMLARLGRTGALRRLTLRQDDDPTIALIDGWASLLDILAFYQEEIANEGYLRTAEEPFSVRQLAAGIGYRLLPGVGSSTYLAFDCETTPSTPEEAVIPAGTQVQSTPAPEETAQIFETKEAITGRAAWNALRARLTAPQILGSGVDRVYLEGTETRLAAGQPLLFVAANAAAAPAAAVFEVRWIKEVKTFDPPRPDDPRKPHTLVRLDRSLQTIVAGNQAQVFALRQRAAAFGHNAMKWSDLPLPLRVGELHPTSGNLLTGPYASRSTDWAESFFSSSETLLHLDQVYSRLTAGGWIVLNGTAGSALYLIAEVKDLSHTDYLISAKVTRLQITGSGIDVFTRRSLSVWCESELLQPAEQPMTSAVAGDQVTLNAKVDGLAKGGWIAVTGKTTGGSEAGEVVQVKSISTTSDGLTRLVFETALKNSYDRLSLRLNANVVAADLGAKRGEILGDGDAAVPFKRFKLRSAPLTYVSAKTASGAASTLDLRVDGQRWDEVESFYGHGPRERIYTLTHADDGSATVQFGDGRRSGARPASGTANITANLRVGIGTDGNLPARRIDQLLSRPLGVKGVINPVAAEGAADAEEMADAKRNATNQVRMVERIVSLRDFEDFASGFAGIGKAQAQTLWSAKQRLVHVTVAGDAGATVEPGTTLYDNLRDAMDLARHADEPVQLDSFAPRLFTLKADVTVQADLLIDDVLAAARSALVEAFAFAKRGFGQAVTKSEIAAVLHDVTGIRGIIVTALHFTGATAEVRNVLPAQLARLENGNLELAELLLIDSDTLELSGAF